MIRLIGIDVDGTLLNTRAEIPRENIDAIHDAVLEATKPYRHAAALVFDRDADRQVMFETMDWEHPGRKAYWARNQSLIAQSVPLEDALVEDPIQVMFNGGVDTMRALYQALNLEANGFAVSLTEYTHRDFS